MKDARVYRLSQVRKSHRAGFTLHIDDLGVERSEVLALLGPTGAGKSTLLRLLAGLDAPDAGAIGFEGMPITPVALPLATRRRITLVHQHPRLLSGTVRYNVEYGLRLRKARGVRQAVEPLLERLGLLKWAAQSAQTLSGGQIQLVALARSLVVNPDVLLLDEPTANLDPAHVALVEETLGNLHRQQGMTIVWATHNLFQARRVAGRTALLLNGQLVEVAPTETFFEHPVDRRTADFVQGRMVY